MERLAAIEGTEDAAFFVGAVGVAEGRDEEAVGVAGVESNVGNLLGVEQADVCPGFAAVGGFVNAVADREVGAHEAFAGADIDDVRVGGRHGNGSDGTGGLLVKQGLPGSAGIVRLPDSSVDGADEKGVRLGRHARHGTGATRAQRTDSAPLHVGKELRIYLGGGRGNRCHGQRDATGEISHNRLPA